VGDLRSDAAALGPSNLVAREAARGPCHTPGFTLRERAEPVDPRARAVYGELLSKCIQACTHILPNDLLQEVLGRMNDLDATRELRQHVP
jgi:hypothetical protein